MNRPLPAQWRQRLQRALVAAPFALVLEVAANIVANLLNRELSPPLQFGLLVALVPVGMVLHPVVFRQADDDPVQVALTAGTGRDAPLPPPTELLGREQAVNAVVQLASRHGLVFVHGPSGIGASAVAVEAARRLAPTAEKQIYVDLRGQNPGRPDTDRRVAIRLLSVLGQKAGRIPLRGAARRVRESLGDPGKVLVLDNVTQMDQVSWIAQRIPGQFLIVAGDFEVQDVLAGEGVHPQPTVSVGPLDQDSAVELLARQDIDEAPQYGLRDRLGAEPEAARELVERYLTHPQVAIELGKWLAANPDIALRRLLDDMERQDGELSSVSSRYILRLLLSGASHSARTLMASLAHIPIAELSETAVAAMTGVPTARAVSLLEELIERKLVVRTEPNRYRLQAEARSTADPPTLQGAFVRLAGYYASLGARYAKQLTQADYPEQLTDARRWFRLEDTALLELLNAASPPERAAASLWTIADALDAWFTLEDRGADREAAAQALARAARELGDPAALETASLRLMAAARLRGDLAAAERYFAAAQELGGGAAEQGRGSAGFHVNRGLYFLTGGHLDEAYREFQHGADRRPHGDGVGRVVDRINMGVVLLRQGRLAGAYERLHHASAKAREIGDLPGQAHSRELLGVVACRDHNTAQALNLWDEAARLYEKLGDDVGGARCLLHSATVLLSESGDGDDRWGKAADRLRQSLELYGDERIGVGVALAHLHLGEIARSRADDGGVGEHRQAGLEALRPWEQWADQPAEVASVRARLTALAPDPPA